MYNENRITNAYEQYGQVKKAQANKGSTYDEVTQTVTSGLGSPLTFSTQEDPEDTRTFDQKIYDGLKRFGAALNPFSQPDRDSMLLDAYDNDDIFVLPEPTPVAETGIDDGSYDFIDMSKFAASPRQPRTQPNMDATPTVELYATGISDEAPSQIKPLGLMSPPSMEQDMPDVPAATNLDVVKGLPNAPYTIQAGDTLQELADMSGSTVEELVALNNIKDKNKIIAGAEIKIPIYRDADAEVVTKARSMEELQPIKASYVLANQIGAGLAKKPTLNTFQANIGKFGEGDHGSTPVITKDAAEADKPDSEKSLDIGYGHKIKRGSQEDISGEIYGIKYKNEDGTYIPLTEEQKLTILRKDFEKNTNLARSSGWDKKLEDKGSSWDELDPKYKNALTSLAINVGGAKAGDDWTEVLQAAIDEDPVAFAKELRRKDAGKNTKGMDNRVMKELYYAGIITSRSEVESVLPKANFLSGVPK